MTSEITTDNPCSYTHRDSQASCGEERAVINVSGLRDPYCPGHGLVVEIAGALEQWRRHQAGEGYSSVMLRRPHSDTDKCCERLDRALRRTALETVEQVSAEQERRRAERLAMHDDGCAEGGPCGFCESAY